MTETIIHNDDEPIVKKISRYDPVACKKYYDKPDVKARKLARQKEKYKNNKSNVSITYCLECNITGEKYYGSTSNTLEIRFNSHHCKTSKCVSKQIIDRGDYDIYQLGEYKTELEAKMKEKWYINNKKFINKQRICVTKKKKKKIKKEF